MALPRLNTLPKYELTIPSISKRIRYRPYLVQEEKALLVAFESKDARQILNAMADTVQACVDDQTVSVRDLAVFDVEFIFAQLRAKSVGETSTVMIKCQNDQCEHQNEVKVDLSAAYVDVDKVSASVPIGDDVVVELKYPSFAQVIDMDTQDVHSSDAALASAVTLDMFSRCIDKIKTPDEIYDTKDESPEEVNAFVESLRSDQLKLMAEFVNNIPSIKVKVVFDCVKCGHHHDMDLKGLADFF